MYVCMHVLCMYVYVYVYVYVCMCCVCMCMCECVCACVCMSICFMFCFYYCFVFCWFFIHTCYACYVMYICVFFLSSHNVQHMIHKKYVHIQLDMKQRFISIRAIQVLYMLPAYESQKKMRRIASIVPFVKERMYKLSSSVVEFHLVANTYIHTYIHTYN